MLRHELRDGAGRIELTGGASALQFFEDGLVNLTEGVALLIIGEIQLVDHVDDLAQQYAVLHVLVGVGKGGLHDGLFDGRLCCDGHAADQNLAVAVRNVFAFQDWEQRVVNEIQQCVAGHALSGLIVRPIRPTAGLRDDGLIIVIIKLPVLLLGVIDLEKQHPRDLFNALCVAVDARVVAHDVTQTFYKSG